MRREKLGKDALSCIRAKGGWGIPVKRWIGELTKARLDGDGPYGDEGAGGEKELGTGYKPRKTHVCGTNSEWLNTEK